MGVTEDMAKVMFHSRHLRGEPPVHCCDCGRTFSWDDYTHNRKKDVVKKHADDNYTGVRCKDYR